jgi:hypothetical protein
VKYDVVTVQSYAQGGKHLELRYDTDVKAEVSKVVITVAGADVAVSYPTSVLNVVELK